MNLPPTENEVSVQPIEYFVIGTESISNINFEDTTTATVTIQLAGGLCNRTLGNSIINVKRDTCPGYVLPLTLNQDATLPMSFQGDFVIPAHEMIIEFGRLLTSNAVFNLEVARYLTATANNSAIRDLRNVTSDPTGLYPYL
jgi:hypothetical protein